MFYQKKLIIMLAFSCFVYFNTSIASQGENFENLKKAVMTYNANAAKKILTQDCKDKLCEYQKKVLLKFIDVQCEQKKDSIRLHELRIPDMEDESASYILLMILALSGINVAMFKDYFPDDYWLQINLIGIPLVGGSILLRKFFFKALYAEKQLFYKRLENLTTIKHFIESAKTKEEVTC